VVEENDQYGIKSDESLEIDQASEEKIKMETERVINLVTSIKQNGYDTQSNDPIGCIVLVHEDKWKWLVRGGQHRASVLAALGYDKIPVLVRRIVRREDVCYWPNVQSGIFTQKQALMVFDKLFAAEPPPVAKDWVDYVNKTFYCETNVQY